MNQPLWIVFGAGGYIGGEFVTYLESLVGRKSVIPAPPGAISNHLWFSGELDSNPRWQRAPELRIVILAGAGVIGLLDKSGFEFNSTGIPAAVLHMSKVPRTRIFIAGSSFEYGLAGSSSEFLDPVFSPLEPTEPYGISKKSGFVAIRKEIESRENLYYGRLFQVWGGNEPMSRLVPSILRNSIAGDITELTSGMAVRDFISVRQVCEQIYNTFQAQESEMQVFNICHGQGQTVESFCRSILDLRDLDQNLIKSKREIEHPYHRLVGVPGTTPKV